MVANGSTKPEETNVSDRMSRRPAAVFRVQPPWVIQTLLLVLLTALVLYAWQLGSSGITTYYASAAKSMAANWRAFAFGSLDPGSNWTLDKLSGFLIPAALAIKVFGFHPWVLDLPQVIEGLVTILASFVIGTRWRGPAAGILMAVFMTVTPLLAAMFGHPTEDAMLTMAMVLAFAAWQRAVLSGRFSWMILAGAWVAIGFQAKMMQAWLIVPALLIGFVVGTSGPLRHRIGKAFIAGLVIAALSVTWIGLIQLVPASDRPYIDGTTNNNGFSMVFAYNGVDRILPGVIPGAVSQLPTQLAASSSGNALSGVAHLTLKMLAPDITTQIGWLYPAAALGALLGLLAARRRRHSQVPGPPGDGATLLTAGLWLGLTGVVLSLAVVPHASYFGVIALPLALLAAAAVTDSFARVGSAGTDRWLVAGLVAAQSLWAAAIVLMASSTTRWVAAPILVVGLVAVLGLAFTARNRDPVHARPPAAVLATAIAALLIGPAIWSSFVLAPGGAGSASDAYAGPRAGATTWPGPAPRAPTLASQANERVLLQYVRSHGAGTVRFATDTFALAVSVNLDTGEEVLPFGGFSGEAPWLTSTALTAQLSSGRVRFVLLAPDDPSAPPNPTLAVTRSWVAANCRAVLQGSFSAGSPVVQTLYDCAP